MAALQRPRPGEALARDYPLLIPALMIYRWHGPQLPARVKEVIEYEA